MAKARARMQTDRTELGGLLLGLTALFFMASLLSGCNTARGLGEDISAAGAAITAPFQDDDEDAAQGG